MSDQESINPAAFAALGTAGKRAARAKYTFDDFQQMWIRNDLVDGPSDAELFHLDPVLGPTPLFIEDDQRTLTYLFVFPDRSRLKVTHQQMLDKRYRAVVQYKGKIEKE